MTLVAKLLDVEQQLLRATEVVQLHLSLTNAHVSSKNRSEVDFAEETDILGLIDRVEQAERGLQNMTTQLLVLAKCCTTVKNNEENEEIQQSDNLEKEMEFSVAGEKPEEEEEEVEQMNRSSLEKYTAAAKNAVKMVVDPEDVETLETWRRIVEVDALDANRQFLELLSDGKAEEEGAEAFTKATLFAVSVLTSYQAMSQKPSWLMQLVEDLTDIENAAKDSKFAKVLAPVEKCRDDLVAYCSRNDCDTLEGMLNYVILIERHRGVQTNRLLPYMLTLLRRFIGDCTDYQLRQDVVGEDPRTESEWLQFTEVGKSLANWMQILWTAAVKCSKVDALLVNGHFREFEIRFPGRLPAELHENWCQIIGDAGQQQIDDYAAELESLDRTNYDKLLRGDIEIGISETTPVPVKEIPASKTNPVHEPDTEFINLNVPVQQMGPLEKFVFNSRDFQSKLESIAPKSPIVEKHYKDLITRFSLNMANSLQLVYNDLCGRLAARSLDSSLAIGFDEAVAFTVSLITVCESKTFQHVRIREVILILHAAYEIGTKSGFPEPFERLRKIKEHVKAISSAISNKNTRHLQDSTVKLGEEFRSVIAYAMVRQKIGKPMRWQEEEWQRFNDIGLVLSHCVKRVGKPLSRWMEYVKGDLARFAIMFPGKVPKQLQSLYMKENTRTHFAATIARINRGTVSGAKRARTEPDMEVHPPKRAVMTTTQSNLSEDLCRVIESKLYDHVRAGQSLLRSKNSTKIQKFLAQAKKINIKIRELLLQRKLSNRASKTLNIAIETMASVIWRSPVEYLSSRVVKDLLDQCTDILRVLSTGKEDLSSLTESCKSLQKYWRVHFGDAIMTMRRFIAEANSTRDSNQLAPRVRQLAIFYRNACDAWYDELTGIVPFSRKTQIREELMEIGTVLNDWIERVLAAKIHVQGPANIFDFDMKITRVLDALPDSAPASLAKNLRQVFGIPEPRVLRPRQRTF